MSPLPPALQPPAEHQAAAAAIIANEPAVRDYLQRCAACGLPTEDAERELNGHVEFARSFLANFFPDATY